ncbi:MAG TPA: cobalamin-binding protein [Burkholderiales bacterium]|nr:cobalamin-binding protein [Burkholderiales bacterium]
MRLIVLACVACLAGAAARAEVSAVDSAGRRVALPAPAVRIVSLAPHATEQLFAAGAGARLVAVSDYSDFPAEAKRLPRVGNFAGVNLEAIAALKPDLVVAWRLEATAASLARLESLGIPVFYSEPRRLTEIPEAIAALGRLAGTAATATREAERLRAELERLERTYRSRAPVTLFYQVSESPLMTLGGRHFVSDAIRVCGGRNIFEALSPMAPIVNVESVLHADPQAIVTALPEAGDARWRAFWLRFPALRAVREGNLFAVPANEMHRHGPRALAATALLCERIDEARRGAQSIR